MLEHPVSVHSGLFNSLQLSFLILGRPAATPVEQALVKNLSYPATKQESQQSVVDVKIYRYFYDCVIIDYLVPRYICSFI
jgi:hypothetical protein